MKNNDTWLRVAVMAMYSLSGLLLGGAINEQAWDKPGFWLFFAIYTFYGGWIGHFLFNKKARSNP
jgi:hypothetical protein